MLNPRRHQIASGVGKGKSSKGLSWLELEDLIINSFKVK